MAAWRWALRTSILGDSVVGDDAILSVLLSTEIGESGAAGCTTSLILADEKWYSFIALTFWTMFASAINSNVMLSRCDWHALTAAVS